MQNSATIAKMVVWTILGLTVIAVPLIFSSIYWASVLSLITINALMAASLRTIFLIGEFSLGHVGFMCIGAYTSALLTQKVGLPFGITLLAGGFLAGCIAFILGYPFMRVKGIYFVILTVVTSESFRLLAYNWRNLTGGTSGLIGFPGAGELSIPGLSPIDFNGYTEYYYLTLCIVSFSLFILYRLEKSNLGFTWKAIRETDKMAAAVGINTLRYKVINFGIACFFAGVGGVLLAHLEQTLSAQSSSTFGVMTTIYFLVFMVVGGKSRFMGPIVGVVVLSLVVEFIRPMQEYQPMIIGAIALAVVMLLPEGLISIPAKIKTWQSKSITPASEINTSKLTSE
jgi:branched-chain amino acid transport system permease protein